MTKILVTGGAGYIGQVMCKSLAEAGFDIKIIDNLLYGIPPNSDFEFVKGDICNINDVNKAIKGIDSIIHLAAIANDPATDLDPRISLSTNFEAVKLLKKVAIKHHIERFLFSSSCSVYGDKGGNSSTENSSTSPITLYGKLKVDAEFELMRNKNGFNPVIFRNATVFGFSKRMRFDLAPNLLTINGLKEKKYSIFGGEQWRPFVHVKDVARAFLLGLESPLDIVSHQIFNVGSNDMNYKMKNILPILTKELPSAKGVIDKDKEDKRSYKVDFTLIEEVLGFKKQFPLEYGINEIKDAVEKGLFQDWNTNTQYYCVKHLKKFGSDIFPLMRMKRVYPNKNI